MEWRYVYKRDDIFEARNELLLASEKGETFKNPLLVYSLCINFLNGYQEKCSQGVMTPVWPQDFRKNNNSHVNTNTNSQNTSNEGGNTDTISVHSNNNNERNNNERNNVWRESKQKPVTNDFQKFSGQAWQPQMLNPFQARIRELRGIFNKWTHQNHDGVADEFRGWWKNASDFGYWKPFFVIYEWSRKIHQERVPQVQWYEGVFKTFISTQWTLHQSERQVNPRMKSFLYDGVNSLPSEWRDCWTKFQKEHQTVSIISWKKWITNALELQTRQWFHSYQLNLEKERNETGEIELIATIQVWTSFIGSLWITGVLPMRFLAWAMFTLPLTSLNEENSWRWRASLWEALDALVEKRQLPIMMEYVDCWRRWKNGFTENALDIFRPNIVDWNLRLRYTWSNLCPSWNIEITQDDLEKRKRQVDELEKDDDGIIGGKAVEDEDINCDGNCISDENIDNLRTLIQEWREMGRHGWMDSYFPEWYMELGNIENKIIWWDMFFYTASQYLDLKSIWEREDWIEFIKWIYENAVDGDIWFDKMIERMDENPSEWTIECPYYSYVIDGLRCVRVK
jgi:hypothetical protein